ncbi:MFS transporter [Methanosarcina sp. Mfa9]|uniref:MFS transporter n=1 Tax=Methanosarcina sp. Mfa9 TaxID=3439063 RepID=UPI003F83B2E6
MNSRKLILYSSVFAVQGLCNAAIPVLPELAGGSTNSAAASNLIYSGYFLGAFLTLLPFGVLADRIGNLKVAGLGILLTALSGLAIFLSGNLWVLGISRFVEGMGCGAFFPAAFSMIAEWKDSKRSLGEFNFLLNAGLAAGVLLAGLLAGQGIKTAIGIFTLLAGLSTAFLLTETGELLTSGGNAINQSTRFRKVSPAKRNQGMSFFSELSRQLKKSCEALFGKSFGKIWSTSVLLYGTTGLLTANFPEYSADFLTKPELGIAISASYLAAMLSSLAAGRTKAGYKTIIRVGITFAVTGILLSVKLPLLAFALIGAGGGAAVVGLVTAVSRISSSGFAMGLFNTGIYAGLGLVPVLGSLFLGHFSYEEVFLGSALALLLMLFVKID